MKKSIILVFLLFLLLSCSQSTVLEPSKTVTTVIQDFFIPYNRRVNLLNSSVRNVDPKDLSYRTFDLSGNQENFNFQTYQSDIFKTNFNENLLSVKTVPNVDEIKTSTTFLGVVTKIAVFFNKDSSLREFVIIRDRYELYHLLEVKAIREDGILVNWRTQINGTRNFQ